MPHLGARIVHHYVPHLGACIGHHCVPHRVSLPPPILPCRDTVIQPSLSHGDITGMTSHILGRNHIQAEARERTAPARHPIVKPLQPQAFLTRVALSYVAPVSFLVCKPLPLHTQSHINITLSAAPVATELRLLLHTCQVTVGKLRPCLGGPLEMGSLSISPAQLQPTLQGLGK